MKKSLMRVWFVSMAIRCLACGPLPQETGDTAPCPATTSDAAPADATPADASSEASVTETPVADAATDATPDTATTEDAFSEPSLWVQEDRSAGGILVAGTDSYEAVDDFRVGLTAGRTHPARLERVRVQMHFDLEIGDMALIDSVRLMYRGPNGYVPVATNTPSSGAGWYGYAELLLPTPVVIEPGVEGHFRVEVRLARVESHAAFGDRSASGPYSGSRLMVTLSGGAVGGEWDARYASAPNVLVTDTVTNERLIAQSSGNGGYYFTIHRARPVITSQVLPSARIYNGTQEIARLAIGAEGPQIGIRRVSFELAHAPTMGSDFRLENFQLRRGTVALPGGIIEKRLVSGQTSFGSQSRDVLVIDFLQTEILTGSGQVYSLTADILGTVPAGERLAITLIGERNDFRVIGPLTSGFRNPLGLPAPTYGAPFIDLGFTRPADTSVFDVPMIWTDFSEPDHSDLSQDWINGHFVALNTIRWDLMN